MSNILQNTDWSFLIGKELNQLCIGQYQTQLRFTADVIISIEGEFDHSFQGKDFNIAQDLPRRSCTLVSLIGSAVERVVAESERALIIQFVNKEVLRILVGHEGYESFGIAAPGITINV